jgi:sugar diacid utilization regulator
MSLNSELIQRFETALNGPAPAHDPNWAMTKALLKLVVAQSREIVVLQEQLAAMGAGTEASTAALYDALKKSTTKTTSATSVRQADIDIAVKSMNEAIRSYQSGQQVMSYAGKALRFAILFV